MNYEFYFLRDTGSEQPEVLRVMAPSFDNAAVIVARKHGWTGSRRQVKDYIRSAHIHPVEIQNIFEQTLSSPALP